MAVILLIETATAVCSVGLSIGGKIIAIRESQIKNSHASLVTVFSREIISEAGISFNDIDAFAVSKGPGSYTGLRIGVSTAKGFAYATGKKLLAINSLQSIAMGMVKRIVDKKKDPKNMLFCPMIDARRMEVYTAVYDFQGNEIIKTEAIVVDKNSFSELLNKKQMCFAGDGALKCKSLLKHKRNTTFLDDIFPSTSYMAALAEKRFNNNLFEDVAYFEPFYLKEFIAGISKVKGLR